jgi:predicted Zn-dependent protease
VTAVQNDWDQVKSDAQAVQDADTGDLDSAWDSFSSAVKNVPDDSSVQDAVTSITQSADDLVSAAETTASQVDCTSSSGSTTTTTSS